MVVTAIVALLSAVGPISSASASESSDYVSRINAVRASVGVPGLSVDGELTAACQQWANHMAATDTLAHAPDITAGISQYWLKVGENVGVGPDVATIMAAFIGSPHHYANIVDPAFNRVGVAVAYGGGHQYTCHRFMKVAESNPGPTPEPTPTPKPAPKPKPGGGSSTPTTKPPASSGATTPTTVADTTAPAGPPPPASPGRVEAMLSALALLTS